MLTPPQTDPCSPTPCGPGTTCSVQAGNAICRCQDGFSPNPDTITGCKPECQRDPDCRMGFQCRSDLHLDCMAPFLEPVSLAMLIRSSPCPSKDIAGQVAVSKSRIPAAPILAGEELNVLSTQLVRRRHFQPLKVLQITPRQRYLPMQTWLDPKAGHNHWLWT